MLKNPNQPHTLLPAWKVPKDLNQSERESAVSIALLPYAVKGCEVHVILMVVQCLTVAELWRSAQTWELLKKLYQPKKKRSWKPPKERRAADGKIEQKENKERIVDDDKTTSWDSFKYFQLTRLWRTCMCLLQFLLPNSGFIGRYLRVIKGFFSIGKFWFRADFNYPKGENWQNEI